jgi:outer membrane biosynthesis protein TonB
VTAPARKPEQPAAAPARDGAKRLRVALVRGGRVVEERIVPAPVSVGSSAKATLAVPASDLPPQLTLFAAGKDGPALVEDGAQRPLAMGASGRVVVGEVTVLYEVVPQPAPPPRPALPAAARGNRFRSLDGLFVGVLAAALALHVAAYLGLAAVPVREEVTLEEIPDRFAKILIPARAPEPVVEEKPQEQVAEAKREEEPPEEPKPVEDTPPATPEQKAARAAAVAKAVQSKGLLRVLGSLGSAGGAAPAVAEVFGGDGGGLGDVAQALSGVAPAVAAAGEAGGAPGGRRGAAGDGAGAASIGELGGAGGGRARVDYGAKTEVAVAGSVAAEAAEIDSADVDQVKLASFVKARMAAIKACYETQLKRNPSLHGKIRIRFTILETGGLDEIVAAENGLGSPEVAACIVGTMRSWRTPFRPGGTVTVEYPFVFSAN